MKGGSHGCIRIIISKLVAYFKNFISAGRTKGHHVGGAIYPDDWNHFYHNVEGMTYLDALYFSVMTLATVGYGDLSPQTALGKVFTIIYVLIGVGIITAVIANFNRALAEYHKRKKHKEAK